MRAPTAGASRQKKNATTLAIVLMGATKRIAVIFNYFIFLYLLRLFLY
jgi:hypothetical protein